MRVGGSALRLPNKAFACMGEGYLGHQGEEASHRYFPRYYFLNAWTNAGNGAGEGMDRYGATDLMNSTTR